ncbi:MAG: bifunctional homocysteine S-methyltransferase/methylenetetrahydrofolate reductase [Lachnospiraceae bacterium]|nr:bifunctional homocysteine S-methyltransferase/methylenetetrahydrofolate reductase [Lachnospiraceae bacterium]
MQVQALKEQLKNRIILMDGAMGTYFNRLHPDEGEAEGVNVTHPEWIQEIHEKYIAAGARLIRTNTFAVNHMLVRREDMEENLTAAVRNAREAVQCHKEKVQGEGTEDVVWIAGSIGPIRAGGEREATQVLEEYRLICDTLFAQGIRIFILETFAEHGTVVQVANYLRNMAGEEDIFILAQFSVNRMGYTQYGYSMQRMIDALERETVLDGFGFNCGIGATHMNQLLGKITFSKDSVFSVLPNAGYDHMLRGRQLFMDNPSYYASVMEEIAGKGVNLIGGCCGTTPEYIRELARVLQKGDAPAEKHITEPETKRLQRRLQETDSGQRASNPFIEKLNRGERVYVVEIDSPFDQNADKFLEAAYRLKENDVDLVTISDSPMAKPRAEAFEMGIYIAGQTGIRVMPHVCCRDRNLIALRSAILGGHINGIRDMLIITGDPVARDDRNTITGVFDMNSIKLMEYVKNMNQEMFTEEPFYYGGALNYAGINIEAIAGRMKKKMEAGCSYFLTQPVYSDDDIERVRELKQRTQAKILLGIMPLVSYRNALYMKNELPGIHVPEDIVNCYRPDMERAEAEETAIRISVEIGKKAMDFADGFYFMTPFNRVSLVNGVIDRLREVEDAMM